MARDASYSLDFKNPLRWDATALPAHERRLVNAKQGGRALKAQASMVAKDSKGARGVHGL